MDERFFIVLKRSENSPKGFAIHSTSPLTLTEVQIYVDQATAPPDMCFFRVLELVPVKVKTKTVII